MTTIFSFILTMGGSIGAWLTSQWWVILLPIGFLVILIAPYRLWQTTNNRLALLTTKRLAVEVKVPDTSGSAKFWRHLRVVNKTGQAITGCYGELAKDARALTPISSNFVLPKECVRYHWTTRKHTRTDVVKIGANSPSLLDIAFTDGEDARVLFTPQIARGGFDAIPAFPLPKGSYEMIIRVGSEDEHFPPTCKKFKIAFSGGGDLEVEDLGEVELES